MAKNLMPFLQNTVAQYPEDTAFIYNDKTMTYREYLTRVENVAARLQAENLGSGARIALLLKNSFAYAISFFGALHSGASIVLLNPLLRVREMEYIFGDSEISAVIADPEAAKEAEKTPQAGKIRIIQSSELLAWSETPGKPSPVDPSGERIILYTSATTGKPKGVNYTGEKLAAMAERLPLPRENVWLTALPLFHIFGLTVAFLGPVLIGGTMVLMERFRAPEAFELLNRHQVTFFPLVPTMLGYLLAEPNPPRVPSLQLLIAGGAALPEYMVIKWYEKFNGPLDPVLLQGYGLTEGPPVATLNTLTFLKPGSVGQPLTGVELQVVDEQGRPLPSGKVGQLVIRDRSVSTGYMNQEEANRATFRNGWCQTGDCGYIDDDGFIYIVGRDKDMIIKGGYNIYPAEIEDVLLKHPKIKDAAVVGVPDPVKGELVQAFLVLKQEVSEEELIAYCRENLAAYKVPNQFKYREDLPRGATGKVLKRLLKDDSGMQEWVEESH